MIIVAILGKSGSGKSTLQNAFQNVGYSRIVTYTTRNIRDGEINHKDYHFIDKEQFKKLEKLGIIIEKTEYSGNWYGSPRPVGHDRNVIVVESEGLRKLRSIYKNQVFSVYISLSGEEIEKRLDKRNNTTDRDLRKVSDAEKFSNIESEVDMVIDGDKQTTDMVAEIVAEMAKRKLI